MKFNVFGNQTVNVSIELDAPWKSRNGSISILMAVNMGEAYVLGKSVEVVKDTKFDVVISKFGAVGLKGGVFDTDAKTFDE